MRRRIAALFLGISLMLTSAQFVNGAGSPGEIFLDQLTQPEYGSIGGEWAVITLARSRTEVPDGFYEGYLNNLEEHLIETDGVLDQRKYTEYSRTALGLAALGENPQEFRGFNLLEPLKDVDRVCMQGSNGPIWALIAVDSRDYDGMEETGNELLERVLALQNEDGGYGLIAGEQSDPDLTAMAMTALSVHTDDERVKKAVSRGISFLKERQQEGFVTCESCAQTLVAYSSIGEEAAADELRGELEDYAVNDGYVHVLEETESNGMSTEQALYSIVAYERMKQGDLGLFDMRDAVK